MTLMESAARVDASEPPRTSCLTLRATGGGRLF